MALTSNYRTTMTAREYEEFNMRKEHAVKDKEIALATLEAKWNSWLRIPLFIVMLPVRVLLGIAYIVAVARKYELPDRYWNFMSK